MAATVLRARTKKLLQHLLIATALCSVSAPALSTSLSEISINSGLHQPFNATILLRNFDPVEADRVNVEIANDIIQSQYNNSTYLPAPLKAKLKRTERGTVVELTSPVPINEPFLKFAVQLSSPNGLILRQYEVLLDPPKSVFSTTEKQAFKLAPKKQPKVEAFEKLKASIQVSENDRAQGIELATSPQTTALVTSATKILQATPQTTEPAQQSPDVPAAKPYVANALTLAKTQQDSLEEVVATVESTASTGRASEALFSSQAMSKADFVAALDEYSLINLQSTQKQKSTPTALAVAEHSQAKPELAALSRNPEAAKPTPVRNTPAALTRAQNPADFRVADSAFSRSTADSAAKALLAYRERARAGKTGGLSSRELVGLSASSVNRVSKAPLN